MIRSKARSVIWPVLLVFAALFFLTEGRSGSPAGAKAARSPQGAVYYVAPTGHDSNPGTAAYPWQTIQKAADSLTAGDTVYIRAGTYTERVTPQNSGSAGQVITYAAYPGETATVDGSGVTLPDDLAGLFDISNVSYITVSGLRVVNAGPYRDNAGILVINSSYITVENNSTYHTESSGIGVWGSHDIVVAGNRVEEAGIGGWQECISIAGTGAFVARNNEVLNCHKEGICIKDGAANGQVYRNHVHHIQRVGIYVDAWDKHTYNIAVFQNVVHDVLDNNGFALASEMGGLLENISIYNNIAYHNRYVGLVVSINGDPITHPMRNIQIVNNTFYNNGWTVWGGGVTVDNPAAQNVVIRNNIVSRNLYFQIAVAEGVPAQALAIDHNLIDGYRGTEGETRGSAYVEGDPLFGHAAGASFNLRQGSPAMDAGSAAGAPSDDFDGRPRPLDGDDDGTAAYDMGAYEMPFYPEHVYLPIVLRGY